MGREEHKGGIPDDHRNLLEGMDTFTIWIVGVISQVKTYIRLYQIVHIKYMQ